MSERLVSGLSLMSRARVLVTGFEPFGTYTTNPSELVVRRLPEAVRDELRDIELTTVVLPVSFRRAGETLRRLLDEYRPDIAIGLGLRAGVSYIAVERVALNIMDARIPDNDGYRPIDEPIEPGGPLAYLSTLPVRSIVRSLREAGIPASLSYSAGTFLCNYVMYILLHSGAVHGYPRRAGFIHLPLLPEQAVSMRTETGYPPSMSLDMLVLSVKISLRASLERLETGDERVYI